MSSLFDLTGKVAIVTGSSRGIGRAIAERLAEHGAKVVVSSRKADACEPVARAIAEKGGSAVVIPCNISYKEQLQNLVDKTTALWGGVDILVCNAAVNPHFGPSASIPDEAFDKIMGSNVRSNFWLTNMVCGLWLTQTHRAERFELAAPRVVATAAGDVAGGFDPAAGAFGIALNDAPVLIALAPAGA